MAIRRANDSGLLGKKFNDASANAAKIADVPGAPSIASVTNVGSNRGFNNGAVQVAITPNSKGGIPASYTVTSSPGNFSATGSSSPITVTGLQSGVQYTFSVTAVGGSGSTQVPAVSQSNAILPTTVPATPVAGVAARTNNTTVSIPFVAPLDGGSTITSYLVQSNPAVTLSVSGTTSPLTVTGAFAQNQAYTFTVVAVNANGQSVASGSTNSVTPNPIPTADGDTFTRTTTVNLGDTTTAGQPWTNLTGTWFANGTQAQSNDSTAVAIIRMNSNFGTTQAGTLTPGTGVVYWATDANNYMATYSFFTEGTSTNCGGYSGASCSGYNCTPSGCCNAKSCQCCATYELIPNSGGGSTWRTDCFGGFSCDTNWIYNAWSPFFYVGAYSDSHSCSCGTNSTVTTVNNYLRTIKRESGTTTTVDDTLLTSNTALAAATARTNVAKTQSLRVVTNSNGSLAINAYAGNNYTGTAFTQRTFTPTFNNKSNGFGIIKAPSGVVTQGSTVDDFQTTGF